MADSWQSASAVIVKARATRNHTVCRMHEREACIRQIARDLSEETCDVHATCAADQTAYLLPHAIEVIGYATFFQYLSRRKQAISSDCCGEWTLELRERSRQPAAYLRRLPSRAVGEKLGRVADRLTFQLRSWPRDARQENQQAVVQQPILVRPSTVGVPA
jgi:hypothetical protein